MGSAMETAYEYIKAAVMSGDLSAGDRVKEELIAEKIGVSRTPIRQALQRLTMQGFLEMSHHQGARVADWNTQELSEITELRAQLEGFGAGIAAGKISDEQLAVLNRLADHMEAASATRREQDFIRITDLNSEFHMTIIEASGNRRLAQVIGNLAHPLLVQRRFSTFTPRQLQRSMAHHREIIDALSAKDSEWASAIMRSHILSSTDAKEDRNKTSVR